MAHDRRHSPVEGLPPFIKADALLGDKLHHLAEVSPIDVEAIELIVDDALRRYWLEKRAKIWGEGPH